MSMKKTRTLHGKDNTVVHHHTNRMDLSNWMWGTMSASLISAVLSKRNTMKGIRVKSFEWSRTVRAGLNIYRLKDFLDEEVEGTFYEPELQHITADPNGVFNIDHVIRSRKRKGHEKEYLIKWMHWPEKFNSWVKASDMQDV